METHFVDSHVGLFLGIAPTGKSVRVPVTTFVTFRERLLSGERFYWNLVHLMQQISAAIPRDVDWDVDAHV